MLQPKSHLCYRTPVGGASTAAKHCGFLTLEDLGMGRGLSECWRTVDSKCFSVSVNNCQSEGILSGDGKL
jgi:hypothetical protein